MGRTTGLDNAADRCGGLPRHVHPISELRSRATVAFMERQLTRAIGRNEIARELKLLTTHFSAPFRARFGCRYARHLTRLRLERARVWLEGQRAGCRNSPAVGFASASHFAQANRDQFGEAPSTWRRERS